MYMTSVAELLGMITSEGWRIHAAVDNRRYAMPTFEHWQKRIEAAYPNSMKRPVVDAVRPVRNRTRRYRQL